MQKKAFVLLIAIVMLFGIQAASAETYLMAGYDGQDSSHDWSTNDFFQRMEDETGITFEYDEYTDYDAWQEAKATIFSSGVLPDVLFKASLSVEDQIEYSENGMLIDLLPLLEEYAPNLWALLQDNPEWLAAITLPDGKVVALPTINTLPTENAMWINQTWLDTLGLETPTTMDELVTVLNAFLTQDPNQNGKSDEIPLSFLGPWDLKFLAHAYGLIANDYNIYVDDTGTVQFMPLQDNFIDFLTELAALYDQELLDNDGFTTVDTLRTISDDDDDVTYGVFFGPNPYTLLTVALGEQYTLLQPLYYDGEQVYRDLFGPITTGAFAITSACDDPGAMLSWIDILYTPEGAAAAMSGTEGKDYTVDSDGLWEYGTSLESDYILYDLSVYDTGYMPWMFPVDFYASYELESLRTVTQDLITLQSSVVSPFPYYYVLTQKQSSAVNPLQLALGKYIDESIARFATGELDIHSQEDIQTFYNTLDELGVQEFITFWQDIYDQQAIR